MVKFKVIDACDGIHDAYGVFVDTEGDIQFILCDNAGKFYKTNMAEGFYELYEEPDELKASFVDDSIVKELNDVRKMIEQIKIPNLMNADEGALACARQQKQEAIKALSNIIKEYKRTT